jgi:hypothetical protein
MLRDGAGVSQLPARGEELRGRRQAAGEAEVYQCNGIGHACGLKHHDRQPLLRPGKLLAIVRAQTIRNDAMTLPGKPRLPANVQAAIEDTVGLKGGDKKWSLLSERWRERRRTQE